MSFAISTPTRCKWCTSDPLYIKYHDDEWGIPLKNEQKLFELLMLEGMQAGLSWLTVLKKRENFRDAFDNFDPYKISRYSEKKVEKLLTNEGIIRNRLKISAIINNSKCYLSLLEQQSLVDFIWQFAPDKQKNSKRNKSWLPPTRTIESDQMSKALLKLGFKFVGTTICYAFMQAAGLVNDHDINCFRFLN